MPGGGAVVKGGNFGELWAVTDQTGRAVQVEPMKPMFKAPGTECLNL